MTRPVILAALAAFGSMAVVFVLKTLADTAFLAEYGAVYVPHFMVAEAVAVVTTSALYSAILRRTQSFLPDLFLLATLAAASVATPAAVALGGRWVFGATLAIDSLASVVSLAVWNAATAVVQGRRARILLPSLSAAATSGAVVGSFGASAVTAVLGVVELGFLAAGLIGGLFFLQILLLRIARRQGRPAARKPGRVPPPSTTKARWLLYTAIAAAVVAAFLTSVVEVGFKAELQHHYGRRDMGVYFALFYGSSNLAVLVMQLFVTSRLLASQPLRVSMAVQPLSILGLAVAWALHPGLALATAVRGTSGVFKFALDRPLQEVALLPLGERERQRAKVLIRGVFGQGGNAIAALALIAAGPWMVSTAWPIPAVVCALAAVWLWLQRQVSRLYLDTIGSTLGMGRLLMRARAAEVPLDRDSLERMVAMLEQPEKARFARDLLSVLVVRSAVLAPYLAHENDRVRQALYAHLAAHPSPACTPALRRAVAAEADDSEALAAGLSALIAAQNATFVERARALATGDPAHTTGVAWAAWQYLAHAGVLDDDPGSWQVVLRKTLEEDGVRAAALCHGAMTRGLSESSWRESVLSAMSSTRPHQGYRAAAALGQLDFLAELIKAIDARRPGVEDALTHLDPEALAKLVMLINARKSGPMVRARLLRGLRGNVGPGAVDVALRWLDDDDQAVRDAAVRTLLHWMREGIDIPREPVSQALAKALDRLRVYVHARAPYPSYMRESSVAFRHGQAAEMDPETFFIDELERRTEDELSKVCDLLALMGNPDKVFAAAHELRGPTLKHRVGAVDILQEVSPTAQRSRLFELLDRYLRPTEPQAGAQREVCELDPWLARCLGPELEPVRHRLTGLRAVPLFDTVPGEALVELAHETVDETFAKGTAVVEQGQPGSSLYVVLDGTLRVERDGAVIGVLTIGEYFGELALVDGGPRQASVYARSDVHLLRLPRAPFLRALENFAELRIGLARGVARWLRKLS